MSASVSGLIVVWDLARSGVDVFGGAVVELEVEVGAEEVSAAMDFAGVVSSSSSFSSSEPEDQPTSSSAAAGVDAVHSQYVVLGKQWEERTLEHLASALLLALDDMAEEVVSAPKRGIVDFLGDKLLHCVSQLLVLLKILSYGVGLLLRVECLLPFLPLRTRGVLEERVQR